MKKILILALLSMPLAAQTTGGPLNLNLPVQGSQGWGNKLNQNFTLINSFASSIPSFPGSNGIVYRASSTTLQPAVFANVVSLWTSCTSGYLAFDGTCSTPVGGVSSVFGRTGVVMAANGDYSFSLISGTATAAQLPTFGTAAAGIVPASGGGTTNFLRADGTWAAPPGGGGSGTVTSVALSVPTWAGVSGSPITTSGTLALTLPTFVPSGASHAPGIVPDPGASAGTTKYLREDGTWTVPPGGTASPGGSTGQLQYNNAGAFGGMTGATVTGGALASLTIAGSGGTVLASGIIDGHTPTEVTTATSNSVGSSTSGPCAPNYCLGEYLFNNASATTTYTLPVAEAGRQYCFRNATGKTNIIVIQTSGSGQFIDNQGANTTSGGNITSAGALGDSACVVGASGTQWYAIVQSGVWQIN